MLSLPTFTEVSNTLSDLYNDTAFSHCNLVCVSEYDENCIVTADGGVFSAIEIMGTNRYLTSETEVSYIAELDDATKDTLREPHQNIGIMYVRDPNRTMEQLNHCFHGTTETIKRLGIDALHFFEQQKQDLERHCAFERVLLIVKTNKAAITHEPQDPRTLAGEPVIVDRVPPIAQNTLNDSLALIQKHQAFTKVITGAFKKFMVVNPIDAETYLSYVKEEESLAPMGNSQWRSKSLFDPEDMTINDSPSNFVTHPPLAYQLITDDKEAVKGNRTIIDCGTHYTATIDREFFHKKHNEFSTFSEFFSSLEDQKLPLRMYFELETGTEQMITELSFRQTWLLWFLFTQYARNINHDIRSLIEQADKQNATLLKGTLSVATWANDIDTVKERIKDIQQALMSWGSMTPRLPSNQFAGYYATIPAFSKKPTARNCIQRSNYHLATLPISRAATPVTEGGICLSSTDGKLVPIDPTTTQQDYQATLIVGGMASGKTVFSSVYNNAVVFGRGNVDLPPFAYVDFGSGVHNYFNSLKAWLPQKELYKVTCLSLKNKDGNAINILEPQFGLNDLEETERAFATSFLTRLVNGTGKNPVNGNLSNAIFIIVETAFKHYRNTPLGYESRLAHYGEQNRERDLHTEINELIESGAIRIAENEVFSWYNVRDKLYAYDKEKYFAHARFAHRQGSFDLKDAVKLMSRSEDLRNALSSYRVDSSPDVQLIDYITTQIDAVTRRFKFILGRKSEIDVSQARMVGIDLRGVAGSGTDDDTLYIKQLFGMVATQLATRNFWRDPESFLALVPELYQEHYRQVIAAEASLPRSLFIDEYKQMKSDEMDSFLSNLVLIGRKYLLYLVLAMQRLNHAPPDFLTLASNIYCLTIHDSDATYLQKTYKLSDSFASEMMRQVRTDTEFGRIILYIAKYRSVSGYMVHLLRNQITSSYLWNFASDKPDEMIKMLARKRYGEKRAFLKLAKAYPNGSAKDQIEKRLSFTRHDEQALTQSDVITEIVESLATIDVDT